MHTCIMHVTSYSRVTPTFGWFDRAHQCKMASGEEQTQSECAGGKLRSADLEQQEESSLQASDPLQPHSSPQLSRRALVELGQLQEATEANDPENYPLHSPWAFWFER